MSQHRNQKRNEQTILEVIIIGIFKALWFLITLPFKGFKKGKKGLGAEEKSYITGKRLEIEKMLNSQNDIELKHAVMEADKLVDHTFQQKGYPGATFADRLRSAQNFIDSTMYNSIWQAHIVRNKLAHEQELKITNNELRDAANKLLSYLRQI